MLVRYDLPHLVIPPTPFFSSLNYQLFVTRSFQYPIWYFEQNTPSSQLSLLPLLIPLSYTTLPHCTLLYPRILMDRPTVSNFCPLLFTIFSDSNNIPKDCMERTIPYFTDHIVPDSIAQGKNVLIASSENAIRGLLMHLCEVCTCVSVIWWRAYVCMRLVY